MIKKKRHSAILSLISENEICTQEELTSELIKQGYNVSQSTVSRDINELNLIKAESKTKKNIYVQALSSLNKISEQQINLLRHILVSVSSANNIVVVKTLSGNAGSAGMVIDEMNFSQVLGCVAGDDVVIIIAKSNSDAEIVSKALRNI